jgi:UDP-N-acetylmuramoylalanine--D-glutamate ligase
VITGERWKKLFFKNMNLNKLQNKKICILGYGIENRALVDFLILKKIPCEITICDANNVVETYNYASLHIVWRSGKNYDKNLSQFDIIFRVAGYPLFSEEIKKAKKSGTEISSPTKLFFELCPTKNIIGVTGTKGKGTTASLIFAILKKTGKRVWFGGNIGTPMFSFFEKIKENDWVILELSSFQLEDLKISPRFAVFTNFYKEHLSPADPNNPNYHKTISSYWKSKANIFLWQDKNGTLIANKKIKNKIKNQGKGKKIYFTKSDLPSKLIGEHNKENIAATVSIAEQIKISQKIIASVVADFKGLEHRLEFAGEHGGIKFYDDSFSTTPENAIAALNSFNQPIILLAGGADKGSNFGALAKLIKQKTKLVILFKGKASPRLKKELEKIKYPKEKIKLANSMPEAIVAATKNMTNGNIILLSPGCASFGIFKNYKERGNLFKQEVNK